MPTQSGRSCHHQRNTLEGNALRGPDAATRAQLGRKHCKFLWGIIRKKLFKLAAVMNNEICFFLAESMFFILEDTPIDQGWLRVHGVSPWSFSLEIIS
jgi:hypothetical protein